MRVPLSLVLAFWGVLLVGCGRSGHKAIPTAPLVVDVDAGHEDLMDSVARHDPYPIPQDAAQAAAVRTARLNWYRRGTVGVFDAGPAASAPWAGLARAAMEARAAELSARALTGVTDHARRAASDRAVRAAVAAGCDDPLIGYWAYTLDTAYGRASERKTLPRFRQAVAELLDSRYPDVRKMNAVHNLLAAFDDAGGRHPLRDEEPAWEGQFWELFERVAATRDPIADENLIAAARMHYTFRTGRSSLARHKETLRHLRQAGASEYVQLVARGQFLTSYAWAARGIQTADKVTETGARLFGERLIESEADLERAWKVDPSRWEAPCEMLTVCMGLSHPRAEMEKWFARAMTANPDCNNACEQKLLYLHPKWHGSVDEYVGFAWKCVRTGNREGHLPYAFLRYALAEESLLGREFRSHEAWVRGTFSSVMMWAVVRHGLESQLEAQPDDRYYRSLLARMACIAGRYEFARAAFATLGTDWHPRVFADRAEFETFRREAETGNPHPDAIRRLPIPPAPPVK